MRCHISGDQARVNSSCVLSALCKPTAEKRGLTSTSYRSRIGIQIQILLILTDLRGNSSKQHRHHAGYCDCRDYGCWGRRTACDNTSSLPFANRHVIIGFGVAHYKHNYQLTSGRCSKRSDVNISALTKFNRLNCHIVCCIRLQLIQSDFSKWKLDRFMPPYSSGGWHKSQFNLFCKLCAQRLHIPRQRNGVRLHVAPVEVLRKRINYHQPHSCKIKDTPSYLKKVAENSCSLGMQNWNIFCYCNGNNGGGEWHRFYWFAFWMQHCTWSFH